MKIGRGTLDVRYRPEFTLPWFITFTVRFNPMIITIESILNLVEIAGFHIGIGDWRPEKNGTHGMFRVVREEK